MKITHFFNIFSLNYSRLGIAGLSPIMPGTCGSALAAILAPWLFIPLSMIARVIVLLFIFYTGSIAATKVEQILQKKDPQQVVIDELLGMWITLLPFTNPGWVFISLAFVLFRLFDIIKIWPVKNSEKWLPNGYGIMIDDVFAGIQTLLVLYLLLYLEYITTAI